MLQVRVKTVRAGAGLPSYTTAGAAGADLCACLDAPLLIAPGTRVLVPTGIALALPDEKTVALLCARSGLAHKHGLSLSNGVGVIDSDYRGEVMVSLSNNANEAYTLQPGERIAQILFMPVEAACFVPAETLDDTVRGAGGFGSTGR